MFVETSAFVAHLAGEPDQARLATAIQSAGKIYTCSVVRLETVMVLSRELGISPEAAQSAFDKFVETAGIDILPFTDDMARLAVSAFSAFGKGRGKKAQLNLGDCLVYGAAKDRKLPILFIGNDFSQTDLESVLADSKPLPKS